MRSPLALLALLALPLLAQEPAPADLPFSESIDVKVVNVEVTVTDRQGRRVTGLTRGDFELQVDGRPVELSNFEEIAESPAVTTEMSSAPPDQAAVEPRAAPMAPMTAPPPLNLVVLVDNYNLRPASRNRVLRQLRTFLEETVGPRDRVMLVTHDLGLQVRRPLKAGTDSLAEDLARLEKLSARGPMLDSQTRQAMERIKQICMEGDPQRAEQEARSFTQVASNDVLVTLNSLKNLVESLAGIEGRKILVYVSDGIPLNPGEEAFALLKDLNCSDSPAFSARNVALELREVTTAANANRVTFYTLEAAGVRGYAAISPENEGVPSNNASTLEFMKTADVQQSLANLASETGGRAILNANQMLPDLRTIAGELRSYYSLGYTPEARSRDGRVHRIEVKIKRDGLRVQHRTSHREMSRPEELAARVQTALLHGLVDNPLQARLDLAASEPAPERGQHLVTLRLQVPLKQLVLLARDSVWVGKLNLWVGVRDEAGRMSRIQALNVPIQIPAAQAPQILERPLVHEIRMKMGGKGEQTVAVGLEDELGRTTSFISQAFQVEKRGVTVAVPGR